MARFVGHILYWVFKAKMTTGLCQAYRGLLLHFFLFIYYCKLSPKIFDIFFFFRASSDHYNLAQIIFRLGWNHALCFHQAFFNSISYKRYYTCNYICNYCKRRDTEDDEGTSESWQGIKREFKYMHESCTHTYDSLCSY